MSTDDDDRTSRTLLLKVRDLGDQEAWSRFDKCYRPIIREWAIRTGLSAADDDVVQVVMLKLTAALPDFEYDPQHGFRRWLRKVVRNAIIDGYP